MKTRALWTLLFLVGTNVSAQAALLTGTSTGWFNEPVSTAKFPYIIGAGTDSVKWGVPFTPLDVSSQLWVSGKDIEVHEYNTPFVIGEVHYLNGQILQGTELNYVRLFFDVQGVDEIGGDMDIIANGWLQVINTINTAEPDLSADVLSFVYLENQQFQVLEGQLASADVYAMLRGNGDIDIIGFTPPPPPPQGPDDPNPPVPEPTAIGVWALALAVGLWIKRRRRQLLTQPAV